MVLDILIFIHRKILEYRINRRQVYDRILKQSQKLDKLITKKTLIIMNKRKQVKK